ncbi:MAG: hypothetical protein H6850_01835 [Alphaproteobacteria bacterium]|nr:MAG: hypothetical protein H6850_01835 [Alphaproteobacteria bacterium]
MFLLFSSTTNQASDSTITIPEITIVQSGQHYATQQQNTIRNLRNLKETASKLENYSDISDSIQAIMSLFGMRPKEIDAQLEKWDISSGHKNKGMHLQLMVMRALAKRSNQGCHQSAFWLRNYIDTTPTWYFRGNEAVKTALATYKEQISEKRVDTKPMGTKRTFESLDAMVEYFTKTYGISYDYKPEGWDWVYQQSRALVDSLCCWPWLRASEPAQEEKVHSE